MRQLNGFLERVDLAWELLIEIEFTRVDFLAFSRIDLFVLFLWMSQCLVDLAQFGLQVILSTSGGRLIALTAQ